MNQKGFTMIEILAAITILGILSVLTIAGYSKYTEYARENAYKVMAKSVYTAAEEYIIDNPAYAGQIKKEDMGTEEVDGETKTVKEIRPKDDASYITINDLIEDGYLSGASDPSNKSGDCTGAAIIGLYSGQGKSALDQYVYYIDICCAAQKRRYLYSFREVGTEVESVERVVSDLDASACSSYS